MEIAEIATLAVIAGTAGYRAARQWQSARQWQKFMEADRPVTLTFVLPEEVDGTDHVAVLAFTSRGDIIKKIPQTEVTPGRKRKCRVRYSIPREVETVCVLVGSGDFCVSGIKTYLEARHFCGKPGVRIWMGEADVEPGAGSPTLHFELSELPRTDIACPAQTVPLTVSELIPGEINTDAMAKCLRFDAYRLQCPWEAEIIRCDQPEEQWISRGTPDNLHLILCLKANFTGNERRAEVEVRTDRETHRFVLCQRVMGQHPDLGVSRRLYVCDGSRRETVTFSVTPESDTVRWQVKKVMTSDGGRWWNIAPRPGELLCGAHDVRMVLEPKPANVHSRTAVITLETGTYPFNRTVDISVMQGLRFNYYIEYPKNDPCTRHAGVIETPLSFRPGDAPRVYTVRVDSNQPWRIISDESLPWLRIERHPAYSDLYSAIFTVTLSPNGDHPRGGLPAARHAVLSLVTDTGIVEDILVYQGGYVRIKGLCWMDRNLAANGQPAPVAIPLGLDEGSTLNHGGYFQFGRHDSEWSEAFVPCNGNWYEGKAENPSRLGGGTEVSQKDAGAETSQPDGPDPSPKGWRIPSHIEMEAFLNRPAVSMDLQREEERTNICILSDDGVPVYLPLCGHRSHINGCRILIAHSHRYWTGSSQSPVYGYSLCVEPSRQMYIMHDMKKYGFPVRCVLDEE